MFGRALMLHAAHRMQAIVLIVLIVGGCGSDIAVAADMSVCTSGIGTLPSVTTPCGPVTCAPGEICVVHQPGMPVQPDLAQSVDGGDADGGVFDPFYRACVVLPPDCIQCGVCNGRFLRCAALGLCYPYEFCSFAATTLTCDAI